VCLSKDKDDQTAWHMAATEGHIEVLETLWDWAKKLQVKPDELKKDLLLSNHTFDQTVWYMAAGRGHVEVLETL